MAPAKRPRATLAQKIQVLDFYHKSNKPQLETVERFKNEVSISTSSFSDWLKNEDELRLRYNEVGPQLLKNSRRKPRFKYEEINRAMDLMVQQRLERREPVSEPILREYWSIYAHQYGVDDPKRLVGFSHGWLSQFKKRHGLNRKRDNGNTSLSGEDTPATSFITPSADDTATASPTDTTPRETVFLDGPRTNMNDSMSTLSLSNEPISTNSTLMNGDTQNNREDYETNPPYEIIPPAYQNAMSFENFEYGRNQPPNPQDPQNHPMRLHSIRQGRQPIPVPPQQLPNVAPPPAAPPQDPSNSNMQSQPEVLPPHQNGQPPQLPLRYKEPPSMDYLRNRNHAKVISQSPNGSRSPVNGQMMESEEGININAFDIEKFIYLYADRFFHNHQFEYPQTLKLFQDFKNSFFNERIVNLRSMQQLMMRPDSNANNHPRQEHLPRHILPARPVRKRRGLLPQQQSPTAPPVTTNGAAAVDTGAIGSVASASSANSTRDIIEDFFLREEVNSDANARSQAMNTRKRWKGNTA